MGAEVTGDAPLINLTTGRKVCRGRAANGHAIAVPPSGVMNSLPSNVDGHLRAPPWAHGTGMLGTISRLKLEFLRRTSWRFDGEVAHCLSAVRRSTIERSSFSGLLTRAKIGQTSGSAAHHFGSDRRRADVAGPAAGSTRANDPSTAHSEHILPAKG
jgi:hypothetical protein